MSTGADDAQTTPPFENGSTVLNRRLYFFTTNNLYQTFVSATRQFDHNNADRNIVIGKVGLANVCTDVLLLKVSILVFRGLQIQRLRQMLENLNE